MIPTLNSQRGTFKVCNVCCWVELTECFKSNADFCRRRQWLCRRRRHGGCGGVGRCDGGRSGGCDGRQSRAIARTLAARRLRRRRSRRSAANRPGQHLTEAGPSCHRHLAPPPPLLLSHVHVPGVLLLRAAPCARHHSLPVQCAAPLLVEMRPAVDPVRQRFADERCPPPAGAHPHKRLPDERDLRPAGAHLHAPTRNRQRDRVRAYMGCLTSNQGVCVRASAARSERHEKERRETAKGLPRTISCGFSQHGRCGRELARVAGECSPAPSP